MGRILIAGTSKGCGKTAITCSIIEAMKKRGIHVNSFKCGPDYLDPMFQKHIIGVNSYNIDSYMMTRNTIKNLMNEHSAEISVIEGIMSYYDGIRFTERASTCEMALITKSPTILVVDCNNMGTSAAAVIYGFLKFSKNTIKGIIFNRLNPALYEDLKKVCEKMRVKCCGYVANTNANIFENKNLSLITEIEINNIKEQMYKFTEQAEKTLDIDSIIELANTAKPFKGKPIELPFVGRARIAVSDDKAFCLHYDENTEMLKKMGAEIVTFSPLYDKELPKDIDGLILCGGFPEMYCSVLSKNTSMLKSIKNAVEGDLPTIAECGGFMYLHEKMYDIKGVAYKMAGIIKGSCSQTKPPVNFGYIELTTDKENLLMKAGDKIRSYEFHRYESTNSGSDITVIKNNEKWQRIHATGNLYAGFPHLHFYSNPEMAERFMRKCVN